jgi:hypothetical protein
VASVKYDEVAKMYPVNLNCQLVASKLLKNALKTQQSFDDTNKLSLLIDKLKSEINIVKEQSQLSCPPDDPKAYLKIYCKSWEDDDDYLSRVQGLSIRQQLIKFLQKFMCYCISRNDPNVLSYNQNVIAHSRKILDSSIIQDDLLFSIFKVYETVNM